MIMSIGAGFGELLSFLHLNDYIAYTKTIAPV
jgi:hypothetical protein